MLQVEIIEQEFEPLIYLAQRQTITSQVGAQAIFVGYMRDFRAENTVDAMTITHYPPMTEQHLQRQAAEIIEKYQLLGLLIAHRVGRVTPTSALVLISAIASHRANATTATQEMLEILKYTAPFWKQEHTQGRSRWVACNSDNKIQGNVV